MTQQKGGPFMRVFEADPLPDTNAVLQVFLRERAYEYLIHDHRPLVIVIPGGGYEFLADREAEPIALAFLQAGYQVCVLRYTIREDKNAPPLGNAPLIEAAQAVIYAREHAAEWGVDPNRITVCGCSAGGHLAASLGVHWNNPAVNSLAGSACRPNAMLLCYAVVSAGSKTHGGSFENLTGHAPALPGDALWSMETQVTDDTCPAFIWHTVADDVVPVENALLMAEAMQRHKRPYALHLFTHGGHGLSIGDHEVGRAEDGGAWVSLALKWLDSMGLGAEKRC